MIGPAKTTTTIEEDFMIWECDMCGKFFKKRLDSSNWDPKKKIPVKKMIPVDWIAVDGQVYMKGWHYRDGRFLHYYLTSGQIFCSERCFLRKIEAMLRDKNLLREREKF